MSTPIELWKKWEGQIVEGKFPLRQWLGGSDHSAVFLTERIGNKPRKAVIKLIAAQNVDAEAQLSRWKASANFSHANVIQLFEFGRCQIDGTRLLYVVMECADENLAEILPVRPLSSSEASEMLRPTAKALDSLYRAGFVHGRIKPSNVMAAGNLLKLSADGLRKIGERADPRPLSGYDAPELAAVGLSPATDVWSLGGTLVAVLTQKEPQQQNGKMAPVAVPNAIPQPHREIARQCLQVDPKLRCTVADVLRLLQTQAPSRRRLELPYEPSKRWVVILVASAAVFLGALIGGKLILRRGSAQGTEPSVQAPSDAPAAQSPAPFSSKAQSGQKAISPGSVRQQVLPDVSRNALNTVTGRVKVSVHVVVDASGNVVQAAFVSHGPSQYFANHALAAAQHWKFNPPQANGQPAASEWLLRFQFGRTSTEVFPIETKP